MRIESRIARAVVTTALLAAPVACEINPTLTNPNAVPDARIDQLLVSIQLNTWFVTEGSLSRYTSMWTQQMTGADRQFVSIGRYVIGEGDAGEVFTTTYTGGGLIDIRDARALAEARNDRVYAGILKIHEAYLVGTAASAFGDIPYSQAAMAEVPEPALDEQAEVYAAVQALLDEAIADLSSGQGSGPGAADMVFGGNAARWIPVAHTLKARYHIHFAEVDPSRYNQALTEAAQGIMSPEGNWTATHSTSATENNLWFMFMRDRSGYIVAGEFFVELLKERNDPRLTFYFEPVSGEVVGSTLEEPDPNASALSTTGVGAATYSFPLVTCAENAFIAAEAAFQTGDVAGAQSWVDRGITCQEQRLGVDLPEARQPLTLEEIIIQKYLALFLSFETWNDYKRTCLPNFERFEGKQVPARIFYDDAERITNSNIPAPSAQPARNDNDPSPCP